MAKWAHSDVLDQGPKFIKDNAIRMLLLKAYTAGDSYATVLSNAICSVTTSSTDYVLSTSSNDRVLTTTNNMTGTASANSGATPDLHVAHTNNVDKVLWVTDETTNGEVVTGITITFPSHTYTAKQPT